MTSKSLPKYIFLDVLDAIDDSAEIIPSYKNEDIGVPVFKYICSNIFDDIAAALTELHALVKGECPSLLDEDSGGDAELDWRIEKLLAKAGK